MSTTEHSKANPAAILGEVESGKTDDPEFTEILIRPSKGWVAVDWKELLHWHELFYTLVIRDIRVRYKQTVLGVAWAVIQPLFMMIVYTVVFGQMVNIDTGGVAAPLFFLAAQIPWTFFNTAVNGAGMSLLNQQYLLTKIYFPRLYLPASSVGAYLVDMTISMMLMAVMMLVYRYPPGWGLLALPFLIALTFIATLGVSLSLAAMTVLYRDFRYLIPFGLQLALFLSPVFYQSRTMLDKLPPGLRWVPALNPMFGIIGAFRSSLLGMPWELGSLMISAVSTFALFYVGVFFFRKTERYFVDIV